MPSLSLLDDTLRIVARRYRLPAMDIATSAGQQAGPAIRLAMAIEEARQARDRNQIPDDGARQRFISGLADLIRAAMHDERGDPAFQAMVLRHRAPNVREYASLSAHAEGERRHIHAAVNALAHPGKLARLSAGPRRDALAHLHAAAASSSWPELRVLAERLAIMAETAGDTPLARRVAQLLDSDALRHLERLDGLESDEVVLKYRSLWDRQGPRSGSHAAAIQGAASKRRGADVEALVAGALTKLAQRLDEAENSSGRYRVVTSLRVPPSIPAEADRAKSEWDAVLLRQDAIIDTVPTWNLCLLVEAKASVDAATTDLPRLMRGLRLLSHAERNTLYPCQTQQGVVHVLGASLKRLKDKQADLEQVVLYCSDAPGDAAPSRLLSAAARMQLLSATASLDFAHALTNGELSDSGNLESVWNQLLESPRWRHVLYQYPMLRQARELTVHIDDLSAAIDDAAGCDMGP
ncbi:MAG TPA: 3-deoxy-D-arabino-heptulosonate 7-phosphate synthase [Burkholderiaceae bacterium]|nr:3-deoxy-D-arabino-heptulosonate 7-phosphate synthase [Burkholderiaceae bacterium]